MKIKKQEILILCEEKAEKCEDCWFWTEYLEEIENPKYQTKEVENILDKLKMPKNNFELKECCLLGCKFENCPCIEVEKEKILEIEWENKNEGNHIGKWFKN